MIGKRLRAIGRRPGQAVLEWVAALLAESGIGIWNVNNHRVNAAIWRLRLAWRLAGRATDAVELAVMYDRVNRNREGLTVLREAFHGHPDDLYLRHMLASTTLRHGSQSEIYDVFTSIHAADAGDPFANFVLAFLHKFEGYVECVVKSAASPLAGRRPFLIVNVVWGPTYVAEFMDQCVASLLAPGNLPLLAGRYDVHFFIFTTPADEPTLRQHPLFPHLEETVHVHIVHYDDELVFLRKPLADRYGKVNRYGANLADYFARLWKFCLMSGAHYVTLEAGRRLDAFVTTMCGDNVLNDRAFARIAELMETGTDLVEVTVVRLTRSEVVDRLTVGARQQDGVLVLPARKLVDAIIDHMPREYFVDCYDFARFPLMLCWRIGSDGIVVHSNHFQPLCVRAGALQHVLGLTIDPLDGRFVARHFGQWGRIHIVDDASIVCVDLSETPLFEHAAAQAKSFSIEDVGLWLSGYWDSFREQLFRTPIRYAQNAHGPAWEAATTQADRVVEEVIAVAKRLQPRRSKEPASGG
jgi:hypothetical protein